MANKSNQDHTRSRSRLKTLDMLDKVVDRLVEGNEKLSISSVARAAGITPGLIHNTYPTVAEKIRNLMGKSARAQRDSKHHALMTEKEKNRALRAENDQLLGELARIASVNQRLLFEISELNGISSGKVVALTQKPGG